MAFRDLYCNVQIGGNSVDVIAVEVAEGYQQTAARCSIETNDISGLNLNDVVTVDIGYSGLHGNIFQGYVDSFTETRLPATYRIECRDVLKRAIEAWLISADIKNPWYRRNISAENLVHDLLNEAGITSYSGAATGFTFGVQNKAEFNMMAVWDAVKMICNILAYNCWAEGGTVYFDRVFPYPDPGDPVQHTFTVGDIGNILTIDYEYSTEELRNRVVVYGKSPIYAEASAVSPYLPAGFYKTAIVSSELIETQSMATQSANYNLTLYNKLTENLHVDAEGDYRVRCRDIVSVTEPFTGLSSSKWFVYAVTHRLADDGYKIMLSLTK